MKLSKKSLIVIILSIPLLIRAQDSNNLYFDGIDNYVNINDITGNIGEDNNVISAEIRFKTNATSFDSANQLLSFHKNDNSNILRIGTGANGGIFIKTGSGIEVQGSGYNDDQWHLLSVIAFEDGRIFAYVDGVNSYEFNLNNTLTFEWSDAKKCSIGQEYDPSGSSDFFTGSISEVRIWNKQLTVQEIIGQKCSKLIGNENDLIALYNFENSNEDYTVLEDSSNNAYNGTIEGSIETDWKLNDIVCISTSSFKNVLEFDGNTNYVNINNVTDHINLDDNVITAEIRFKTNATSFDSANQLLSFHKNDNSNILRIGTGANGGIFIKTGSGIEVQGSGYNDDQWHLLSVIAFEDGRIFAYVDGVNSYEFNLNNTLTFEWSDAKKCSIGQEYDPSGPSDFFTGSISEVRIWNKQLTIEDISNATCQKLIGDETNLIALYNFEDSNGTLTDSSGNASHGIINGSFNWSEDYVVCNNPINDLTSFSIVGDAPYDHLGETILFEKLKNNITENNQLSYAPFLIHVGDIKKGRPNNDKSNEQDRGTYCTDINYYLDAKTALELSDKPTYLLIGDNEWNDCEDIDIDVALANWKSTFTDFNNTFKNDMDVNIQNVREENIAFIRNSVLFLTINNVSGHIIGPESTSQEEKEERKAEWNLRLNDNKNWIEENVAKYKDFVHSLVIIAHARPDYAKTHVTNGPIFLNGLLYAVESFSKPVLYIQGDDHNFDIDENYEGLSNLTKVVIAADQHTSNGLLQVVVTKDTDTPFFYDKKPFKPKLLVDPIIGPIDANTVLVTWQTDIPASSAVRYGKAIDNLRYKTQDEALKTNHRILITNLNNISEYIFEVGTRTSRLTDGNENSTSKETDLSKNNIGKEQLIIYPNPSSGIINLDQLSLKEAQFNVKIFDLQGKLMSVKKNRQQIDISHLEKGIYLLKIDGEIEKNSYTFKIIKN